MVLIWVCQINKKELKTKKVIIMAKYSIELHTVMYSGCIGASVMTQRNLPRPPVLKFLDPPLRLFYPGYVTYMRLIPVTHVTPGLHVLLRGQRILEDVTEGDLKRGPCVA